MASNGKLPDSDLTPINGANGSKDRLRKGGSAAAWNTIMKKAKSKGMALASPTGPASSYRTYAQQQDFYADYLAGGNVAAYPGTSNHGWGEAVDCSTSQGVATIKSIGGQYGWRWGEAPSEWWHVTYYGGYGGSNPGPVDQEPDEVVPLARGDQGSDVHTLQGRIKRLGYHPLKDEYSESRFGSQTEQVVKRFQKNNGLKVDGVVGHKTYDEIKRRLGTVDRANMTENEDHWIDLYYRHHKESDRQTLLRQMETIYDLANPNDWDVSDRRIRYDTLAQIAKKHDKLHVE